jgi:hypothetical protein
MVNYNAILEIITSYWLSINNKRYLIPICVAEFVNNTMRQYFRSKRVHLWCF